MNQPKKPPTMVQIDVQREEVVQRRQALREAEVELAPLVAPMKPQRLGVDAVLPLNGANEKLDAMSRVVRYRRVRLGLAERVLADLERRRAVFYPDARIR